MIMSPQKRTIPLDFAIDVVGSWSSTYGWIPIFGAFAALAMTFAAGANSLPAPFSTLVGSGALTLFKASIMACLIYVPSAAFATKTTVDTLLSDFLDENQPNEGFLMWSLVIVLITATIWLALATYLELPVSTQQSTQGALLGTVLVTEGFSYMPLWNKNENHNFNGGGLLWIFLQWTIAPLVAFALAFTLFTIFKTFLLRRDNAEKRILAFLPVVYGLSAGLLCLFLVYQIIPSIVTVYKWTAIVAVVLATVIGALLSLAVVVPLAIKKFSVNQNYKTSKNISPSLKDQSIERDQDRALDPKTEDDGAEFDEALKDFMQMRVLDTVYEDDERSWASPQGIREIEQTEPCSQPTTGHCTPLKKLLESTPNHLIQTRKFRKVDKNEASNSIAPKIIKTLAKSIFPNAIEYDRQTLIRHALAEKYDEMEDFFSYPQLLASCIFALIQSASEIAAVVSPYGAILEVCNHRAKYSGNGEDMEHIQVTWWFRALGGFVASLGFLLCGWRLTHCLGGKVTFISNSRGLASQLSTIGAVILISRIKLPVSSTQAFVGSLIGVGLADDPKNVKWKLVIKFVCGWILTVVFCCGVAYALFSASIHSPAYVVP